MILRVLVVLLAIVPATTGLSQVAVRSDLSAEFDVGPGDIVSDSITIENTGSRDATLSIYQTDYHFQADGSNRFDDPGSTARSNADWIRLGQTSLDIPPGGSVDLGYRITVPQSGELVGSYWSVIMIEEVLPAPESVDGVAVRTVTRYAIQVVTHTGGGSSSLRFVGPTLLGNEATGHLFRVDIVNDGERMLPGNYYLELFDEAGARLQQVGGTAKRTYPNTSVRQEFTLGSLTPGTYTAIVVADAGGDDVFGAQYKLEVSE